jgi:hypothetical protein
LEFGLVSIVVFYILHLVVAAFERRIPNINKTPNEFMGTIHRYENEMFKSIWRLRRNVVAILVLILPVIFLLAVLKGFHDAENQCDFLTFERAEGKYIVLRKYDNLIAVKVANKRITGDVLLLSDTGDLQFKIECFPTPLKR